MATLRHLDTSHRVYLRILMSLAVSAVVLLSTISKAHAGLIHSITPDQAYLDHAAAIGGSTVFMERRNANGEFVFSASGIHIGDGWILASAHQTLAISGDLTSTYSAFRFGTGNNYLNNRGSILDVSSVFIHPTYRGLGNGYDLAMFKLANPLQDMPASNLFTGSIISGMDAHITGFGLTGQIGVTFPAVADGNLRAGINSITHSVNPSFGDPYFSSRIDERGSQFRSLGFLALPGDSGAGWFVDVNGEWQLAGITSASNATENNHRYGFTMVASRLDVDWINATRLTAVPEPGSLFLLAGGVAIFVYRRQRRVERSTDQRTNSSNALV